MSLVRSQHRPFPLLLGQDFSWEQLPDLSPLNRFRHIQGQLLQLQSNQPVYVHLNMEINGQACVLNAKTAP